jgi:hypothetical protein
MVSKLDPALGQPMVHRSRLLLVASIPVLLAIAVIGLIYIPYPFEGEQAVFMMAAEVLHQGGDLYRDCWDTKQPAIYYIYLLAGSLFGFNETGIYAFEALYLLLFSVILILTLARYFSSPVVAACLPLFTVAFYYSVAGPWHRAQVEAVVGFPLFLMLWFAFCAEESQTLRPASLFLSGLFGGIVLLFKFFFLPILLAIWLPTIVYGNKKSHNSGLPLISRSVLWVLCGTSLPLLIAAGYFVSHETLNLLLWTTFIYPRQVATEIPLTRPIARILNVLFFFTNCAPSLALSVVALSPVASKKLDPLNRGLLLWAVCGFVVILLQFYSWYAYHYVLLFVPVGILAARGVDALWSHAISEWGQQGRVRLALLLILTILFLYVEPVHQLTFRTIELLRKGIPTTSAKVREMQMQASARYREYEREVEFLREPSSLPGPIYVCANPLYVFMSERREPISLGGFNFLLYVREQREQLLGELRQSRPSYIFVAPNRQTVIDERFHSFQAFLTDNYREVRRSQAGVWYAIAQPDNQTVAELRHE